MSKKTLEKSIKKWNRIVKSTEAVDFGRNNCALCNKYSNNYCDKCPVSKETGVPHCGNTPYTDWRKHQTTEHDNHSYMSRKPHCRECLKLARAERDFLVSLRKYYK